MNEKATQCPICKKGKRESDKYCSEACKTDANLDRLAATIPNYEDLAGPLKSVPFGVCPYCGGGYTVQCRCMRSDMQCGQGHEWHHDDWGNIHAGPSDHGIKNGNTNKCCEGKPIATVSKEST